MDVGLETDFLAGGGEMGALIRAKDWSKTPIGPIEGWSLSLRMMVSFLLANRFPLLLWWGPQYISLYNDPYRPVLGSKHPSALGRPVSECWSEIWDVLQPLIDAPFQGGPATWMDDLPLEINRHGFVEETHFTVAYSPVPDDTAPRGIGGVLATVHEITEKVVGERRIVALRDLGARIGEARTAEEACRIAAEAMARHDKDIPFALVYLIDESGREARLVCTAGIDKGAPIACDAIALDGAAAADAPWPLAEVLRSEHAVAVDELPRRFAEVPRGPWSDPPHTALVVPIKSNMAHQLAGFLVAGASPRLRLDEQYRSFVELAAAQIATAIASARAWEEERKRAEALAEIDRAKTLFFSNVSHEFRTPLTLMLGPLEDALAANDLPIMERLRLELAHRNSLRLLKLVNSLLDFSRIEAGRAQASYAPVDLAALTADLASNFRAACDRVGIALVVDCEPLPEPTFVDRDMWEKIVLNLLSNAFKFTFAGEIVVRLRGIDGHVELLVRDTGVGVPAAELPRLFERFHRIEGQKSRTYEGSGIGLALVQELVKLHGGTVRAESEEGRGTTFVVTVPFGMAHLPAEHIDAGRRLASTAVRAEAYVEEALRWLSDEEADALAFPEARRQAEGAETAAGLPKGTRILLADDNADMRAYVRRLLGSRCTVLAVPDGGAALEAMRAKRPDLVLADVMMPGLDGFGLLRAIRNDPTLADIPVIMLSARAGEESRVEGLEAGADDYLVKPFSARELVARVAAHLQIASARQQATEALRRSEERQAFLLQLSDALRPLARPEEIKEATSRLLGQRLGASRVAYFTVAGSDYVVEGDYVHGVPHMSGRFPIASFGPRVFAALNGGLAVWSDDVEADANLTQAEQARYRTLQIRAYIGVPLIKSGRFVAGLTIHSATVRHWTEEEVALAEETIERTWAAVQHAMAENALRESELRFRSLVTAGSEAVYRMSPDWSELRQLIGRDFIADTTDPLRSWMQKYVHPDDQPAVMAAAAEAVRAKSVFELDHRVIRADGTLGWTHSRAVPVLDVAGEVMEWIGTATDISERKRTDEARAHLAAIVESSDDAIVGKDLEGIIRTWNQGAERLFGYTAEEVVGRPVTMLMPPDRQHEEPGILARIRRGERIEHDETVRQRKDGTLIDVSLTISPIVGETGRIIGGSKIARDIGKRKRDEAKALAQRRILEMVATAAPLVQILDAVVLFLEAQEPGTRCGILHLDDEGGHLRRGSGPSLPEAYHVALDGVPITPPYAGSCSEAAHRCATVRVTDTENETRYSEEWRRLMAACGIRAGRSTPIRGAGGRVLGSLAIYYSRPCDPEPADPEVIDIATHLAAIAIERDREREALQERAAQLKVLVDELNHRVKNTLATVQSLAVQSMREAKSAEQGRTALDARLLALARAHDVLTREHWANAPISEIVAGATSAYRGRGVAPARVESGGPEIFLRPKAALAISMALHELATNAVKYGALSDPHGRIAITWAPAGENDSRFRLEWREMDGPPVTPPRRRGFGSRLLEKGLAYDLGGEVRLSFERTGLVCTIEAPIGELGELAWRTTQS
ncbi:MAG TPA: PAS domain S-box protein [Reyranella sp.]|nr:PAS domain S-box protein [Reyranella sp.]